jgi:hypothetical protein
MRTLCRGAALAIALTSALTSIDAGAQQKPDDAQKSSARTLATDGLAAFNAGKYADAVDLFSRAEALVHAPPHLLYMARASVSLGRLVHAHEAYVKITREELPANAPKAFVEAKKAAATEQSALEPRIPKLTIVVKGAEAGADVTVKIDGTDVPSALVGVAHPVDPGAHTLVAAASGYRSKEDVRVTLAEGASETVTLELKREAIATTSPGPAAPPKKRSIAPWIAFGGAVAAAGVGTVFVLQNRSKRDDADGICGSGPCPAARRDEIQSLDSDANKAATFAWIGYGVAVASAALGVTLLVIGKPSESAPSVTVGAGSIGGKF